MKVLLDLRPDNLVQLQETKIDPIRLLSLALFAAFVVISLFNIGLSAVELSQTNAELARIESDRHHLTESGARIDASLKESRAYRDRIREFIAFTRQELPTVEFLSALEGAVPDGLKIAGLTLRAGGVQMNGFALTDQDIIDFGSKLGGMRHIVRRVDAPITTRSKLGGRTSAAFTVTCSIRPMPEILSSGEEAAE